MDKKGFSEWKGSAWFYFFLNFTEGASLTNNSENTKVLRGILSIVTEEIFANFVATKLKSSSGIELQWGYGELN